MTPQRAHKARAQGHHAAVSLSSFDLARAVHLRLRALARRRRRVLVSPATSKLFLRADLPPGFFLSLTSRKGLAPVGS